MTSLTKDAEFSLVLDVPQAVTVVSCKVEEGISKQTRAKLELACVDHLDLDGVLEKDAVVQVAPLGFPERRWTLRVGHIDFIKITDGSLRYMVNLYPAMWLLRFTTNTRKFRGMSAEQIITQILDEHQVEHRFELMRETDKRKYCAQYRETNYDFISRLLEFEGIYYTFDQDGTLVMGDRSPDSDEVEGNTVFELIEAAGAQVWGEPGLYEFRKGRRVVTGAATVSDFNWKKPKVKLLKSRSADADAELEVYDYPVGYRRPDQGARIAEHRLQAFRVPSDYVRGGGNVTSFAPGRAFSFGSLANARFAGDYLIVNAEHDYFNRRFSKRNQDGESNEGEVNYRNSWEAIPKATVYRPPCVTAHPHISGCHTAMVRGPEGEEIHTDEHGRFRAQFHWDREANGSDEDSRWLRNTQEIATGMGLARVGWEQSVAYIDGDPDRPFGFARNINGHMIPEYGQPSNKTRMTAKTPSYPSKGGGFNELRLDDIAGLQIMDWRGERDMLNQVVRDRTEFIEGNETKKVASSYVWGIGNDQKLDIGGDFKVGIGTTLESNVTGNRDKTVTGDEKIEVVTQLSFQIEGNDTETITGDRIVKAAEKSGSITREVTKHLDRTVDGNWQVDGSGNLEILVQTNLTETVGSKKVTCDDGNISHRVGGDYRVNVDGICSRTANKSMGYTSETGDVKVKKSATFFAKERFDVNGEEIIFEAKRKIAFKQGDLLIELTPELVTIKGAMKLDASGDITIKGNIDDLTK